MQLCKMNQLFPEVLIENKATIFVSFPFIKPIKTFTECYTNLIFFLQVSLIFPPFLSRWLCYPGSNCFAFGLCGEKSVLPFHISFGAIFTADFNSCNLFFRWASKVFLADEICWLKNLRASSSTSVVSPTSEINSVRDLIILSRSPETLFAVPVVMRLNVFSIASSLYWISAVCCSSHGFCCPLAISSLCTRWICLQVIAFIKKSRQEHWWE